MKRFTLGPANHAPSDPPVERPALWSAALQMARSHLLFGVGPDNFRWMYGRYLGLDHWDTNVHANSIYFEFLADTGLIGLLAFLLLNGSLLRLAWQRLTALPAVESADSSADSVEMRVWRLALFASLVAWFVHGLLDYFYEFAGTYILFWLIAGLAVSLVGISADSTARVPQLVSVQEA